MFKKFYQSLFGNKEEIHVLARDIEKQHQEAEAERQRQEAEAVRRHQEAERQRQEAELRNTNLQNDVQLAVKAENTLTSVPNAKWTPNDQLQKKYDTVSAQIGGIPSLKYKIGESKKKIESMRKNADEILSRENLDILERFRAVELKQDMMKEEGRLMELEKKMEDLSEYMNDPIFEQWAEYIALAEKYIENNPELKGVIKSSDILNYTSLYVVVKSTLDAIQVSANKKKSIEKLNILKNYFDLEIIYENVRGKHFTESKNFGNNFLQNMEYMFDRLEVKNAGIEGFKIPLIEYSHHDDLDIKPFEQTN